MRLLLLLTVCGCSDWVREVNYLGPLAAGRADDCAANVTVDSPSTPVLNIATVRIACASWERCVDHFRVFACRMGGDVVYALRESPGEFSPVVGGDNVYALNYSSNAFGVDLTGTVARLAPP